MTSTAARESVRRLPASPGVYRFRDERGRTLYIGRAVDLRRRVGSYWRDVGDRPHLARMVPRIDRVEAAVCASGHEAAWLERNLLEASLPPWNRTAGGQEIPLFLVLDEATGALRTAYHPDRRGFGPYLGGTRVRLAMAAVHRVLPLRYATGRLSGSERDMARVLGVDPGDHAGLLDLTRRVLARDPVAVAEVRTVLVARRDAAATALGFEIAARLQAEIEALDWISSEQKVTSARPDDLDVYGWAGGQLVAFGIRAGRVRTWRVRACTRGSAAVRVAGTPPAWRAFADRNAALAAQLTATG